MDKYTKIENLIEKYQNVFNDYFLTLNSLPEKSMSEYKTSAYLQEKLTALKINFTPFQAKVGLWGEINFNKPKTIAVRADIDALPVGDGTFAHRCGHSSHSAGLLSALHVLVQEKIELPFNLRFIFQPGEETGDGAIISLQEKAYQNVDLVLAAHSFNNPKNQVVVSHNLTLSGVGYGKIKITGPGGHSSKSNEIANPLIELIAILNQIQNDLDAFEMPKKHASFCISQVHGGIKGNMIPEEVWAEFCFRYYDDEIQKQFWKIVHQHAVTNNSDLKIKVENNLLNPPIINAEKPLQMILDALKDTKLEIKEVTNLQETFSEDLAFVFEKLPGALVFVGIQDQWNLEGIHKISYQPEKGNPKSLFRFWLAIFAHYQAQELLN